MDRFTRVEFVRFKAFQRFTIQLKHFNILVGPNNAGKSTILAAFRILASAMRRAITRKAIWLQGISGATWGYEVDLSSISVAEENIFFNYDESEVAYVRFTLANKHTLTLYFPSQGICFLLPDALGKNYSNPANFRKHFDCPIGFVPILGPVDHHEILYEKEAARLALFNYRAARNFRNIWYHYPERFGDFRTLVCDTWPGMDILPPEIDRSHDRPRLHMYCPEKRIPRELFWSGFGFQVWCQMLTHLIQSRDVSIFLIDEPDIYLHSELQRQLLQLLRDLGPDVLLATHSTEIVAEAETNDIVLISKGRQSARRINDPSSMQDVFSALGSGMNPILTQLAKTRRVVFVEGKDFQILGRIARRIGEIAVGSRRDFAVVPIEGFNPDRIRSLKAGMEVTLGGPILTAAILDKDYRSDAECADIARKCVDFCDYFTILGRKEIENFLLVPAAIDRALVIRIADRTERYGSPNANKPDIAGALQVFCESKKSYVAAQRLGSRRRFEGASPTGGHVDRMMELELEELECLWKSSEDRIKLVCGKEALSALNQYAQQEYKVSLTSAAIIDAMYVAEIPAEMKRVVEGLKEFSKLSPGAESLRSEDGAV